MKINQLLTIAATTLCLTSSVFANAKEVIELNVRNYSKEAIIVEKENGQRLPLAANTQSTSTFINGSEVKSLSADGQKLNCVWKIRYNRFYRLVAITYSNNNHANCANIILK